MAGKMARQLPIVATARDEAELLKFIRTLSPIRVLIPFADQPESLWISDWDTQDIEGCGFSVWLESFPWEPEYKQTGGPRCPKDRAGFWYVSNTSTAPIIEISRPFPDSIHGRRVYSARDCCPTDGLTDDVASFNQIVDRIWNWVRRAGRRQKVGDKSSGPYFLQNAWQAFAVRAEV